MTHTFTTFTNSAEIAHFIKASVLPILPDMEGDEAAALRCVANHFELAVGGFLVTDSAQAGELVYGLQICAEWAGQCARDCAEEGIDNRFDLLCESAFAAHAQQASVAASAA